MIGECVLYRYNLTKGLVYDRRAVEGDPLIYILTMLLFFSAGIASLMIIYMKKVNNKHKQSIGSLRA